MRSLWMVSVLAASVAYSGVALADAIDGNWCHADGRRMTIRGPAITTPGGSQIQGEYDRHAFAYKVPAGEAGAGEQVSMSLRSEYVVDVRQGGPDAPVQTWNRCSATISSADPARQARG